MFRIIHEDTIKAPSRPCDHKGCRHTGEFRAPKSRENIRNYYYFCLEHIRDYNARWNYFEGYSEEEIFNQYDRDAGWDRPTQPSSAPLILEQRLMRMAFQFRELFNDNPQQNTKRPVHKEIEALSILGLPAKVDFVMIKARYRLLVKKHHPDANKGDKRAEERFKIINNAYITLKGIYEPTKV